MKQGKLISTVRRIGSELLNHTGLAAMCGDNETECMQTTQVTHEPIVTVDGHRYSRIDDPIFFDTTNLQWEHESRRWGKEHRNFQKDSRYAIIFNQMKHI